jgi:hypothetical protein
MVVVRGMVIPILIPSLIIPTIIIIITTTTITWTLMGAKSSAGALRGRAVSLVRVMTGEAVRNTACVASAASSVACRRVQGRGL